MALTIDQISEKVRRLRDLNHSRDAKWSDLLAIRQGNIDEIFPKMFSDDYPKPMVANFIDVAARDIAEVIAPMPTISCPTDQGSSDKASKKASIRTMVAQGYAEYSKLETKMYSGADYYVTYGMLPFIIEPDDENNRPIIRVESPIGAYPEFDRFGRLASYTRRYLKTVAQLIVEFPELEGSIRYKWERKASTREIEMYRYTDKDEVVLFLPTRANLVLVRTPNEIKRIPVAVAIRPGVDEKSQRGQFDDIMWVQVAQGRFANLKLEAAQKSVEAPFALPADVNVLEIGPDATIRSASPEKIRRVELNVPQGVFQEGAELDHQLLVGSRYPQGRLGQQSGSVVTGKGQQALMGGFDTQIKTAQAILAETLEDVISICFEMDETMWPRKTKEVRGSSAGSSYTVTYQPKKDISGDYSCEVTYGLMAGLDPNRALVFGLQARGDKLISRKYLRTQMPWDINVVDEEEQVEIEELRDALILTMGGMAQALPQMVMQGQDPSKILVAMGKVIQGRQDGEAIETLVQEAFAPEPQGPPGVEQIPGQSPMMGASGASSAPPGANSPPPMESLLAGLNGSGNPTLAAGVSRRKAV